VAGPFVVEATYQGVGKAPMIEFDDVSFAYEAGQPVLSGVSLRVEPGRVVAVAGPNGSGKSTLALLANGLLTASGGSVTVDGMDASDDSLVWAIRERVGIVFQNPDDQIVGTLVEEDVAFGPENLGVPADQLRVRVTESLEAVGLAGQERREPHLLSEGQKQRLAVAGVLALRPEYLVLDEPTALLDPVGRRDLAVLVRTLAGEGRRGILLITHRVPELALADEVVVLGEGTVAWCGSPDDLLADDALMRRSGLAPAPVTQLVNALRARGLPVPVRAQSPDEIAGALWPSN
jgi:energy-coupling factor transport system ATP-binding protein